MSHEGSPPPPPDRQRIRDAVKALPVVASSPTLDERAALAALFDIKRGNLKLHHAIYAQVHGLHAVFGETLETYRGTDGTLHLPDHIVRAIIARSAIAGASQTAVAVGEALNEIRTLDAIIGEEPGDSHGGGEVLPPAA